MRKIHKLTKPHSDSPLEGIYAGELSVRTSKPEQNESGKQIIEATVTDAFSFFFSSLKIRTCSFNLYY